MSSRILRSTPVGFILAATCFACEPPAPGPQGDSHTNWLRTCEVDQDCGALACICGVCTLSCSDEAACSTIGGASCLPAGESPGVARCNPGQAPELRMCLPPAAPSSQVQVDTSKQFQRLTGFGATVAYVEDELSTFSDRVALDDAMFARLGLDVLRFRNRYGEVPDSSLAQAAAIVTAATRSLGRRPLVLLGSWSPPAALKQNAGTFCGNNPSTCTLAKTASGEFNYAGLAAHFRHSLDAYARVGFNPDYLSIQNNPDWVPSGGIALEACRFLPSEGSAEVQVNGVSVSANFPGYRQAMAAVLGALRDMPARPRMLAPDLSGLNGAERYLNVLDTSEFDAIGHHLYGSSAAAVDVVGMRNLSQLRDQAGVPLFQTEMQANGFDTAVLIHHTLVDGGAAMYLQGALIGPVSGPIANPSALVGTAGDSFVLQDAYFAMAHYARFTDPGWTRVQASTTTDGLLSNAWLAPDHSSLSVVLINTGVVALNVALDLGDEPVRAAHLTLSAFDGVERMSDRGEWVAGNSISLPPHSIATLSADE